MNPIWFYKGPSIDASFGQAVLEENIFFRNTLVREWGASSLLELVIEQTFFQKSPFPVLCRDHRPILQ
jgi:hypothetical protein